ncbi:HNH endonuclease [Streptomyces phage Forrest]|nr:HNH endonuclease [Streptomyces phage Forrest]
MSGKLAVLSWLGYNEYMTKTVDERFNEKRSAPNENGCIEWTAARGVKGYGNFWYDGKVGKAHRYSLERKLGRKLNQNEFACHTCDNPPCVNEDHLFVGNNSDNQQDAVAKGRWSSGNSKKTHCKRGHEFTQENTRINPRGERVCRACDREIQAERRKVKKCFSL